MVVTGIYLHVPLQLKVDISPSSNGRDQMDVNGIVIHVPLQLKVDIYPSSSGRERMDATGTNIHLRQLSDAATKMCSITLLMKGALPGRVQLFRLAITLVSFPA